MNSAKILLNKTTQAGLKAGGVPLAVSSAIASISIALFSQIRLLLDGDWLHGFSWPVYILFLASIICLIRILILSQSRST